MFLIQGKAHRLDTEVNALRPCDVHAKHAAGKLAFHLVEYVGKCRLLIIIGHHYHSVDPSTEL